MMLKGLKVSFSRFVGAENLGFSPTNFERHVAHGSTTGALAKPTQPLRGRWLAETGALVLLESLLESLGCYRYIYICIYLFRYVSIHIYIYIF